MTLGGGNGAPERLRAGFITANVFRVLGVAPAIGVASPPKRTGPTAVRGGAGPRRLAAPLWLRPDGVGRTIEIGGRPTTVVGVMPAGFSLPLDFGGEGGTQLGCRWPPTRSRRAQFRARRSRRTA